MILGNVLAQRNIAPTASPTMSDIWEELNIFMIRTPFQNNYPIKNQKNQLLNNILPSKTTKLYFIYLPIGSTSFQISVLFTTQIIE